MTRDEVIRLAKETGISKPWDQEPIKWETLERFAESVAATEREACAKICGRIADSVSYEPSKSAVKCYEAIRARGLLVLCEPSKQG